MSMKRKMISFETSIQFHIQNHTKTIDTVDCSGGECQVYGLEHARIYIFYEKENLERKCQEIMIFNGQTTETI